MARVFIEGFELRHLKNWETQQGTITSNATAYGHSGSYFNSLSNAQTVAKNLTTSVEYYVAGKFYVTEATNKNPIIRFYKGTTVLGYLACEFDQNTYHLHAYYGVSTFAEGTMIMRSLTNYRIEARYQPSTSNTGNFQVKVNGIMDINKTATITATATTDIDRISFVGPGGYLYLDDIVIDNSEWPGNTRIQALMPDGSGTSTNWTPSAVDNYDCVNDLSTTITAVDADYVYATTVNALDAYAMSTLISGTNPISEIKCIQVTARAKIDGTCSANAIKLKVISSVNGSTFESSAIQIQEEAWAHYTYLKSDTANITPAKMEDFSIGLETTKV